MTGSQVIDAEEDRHKLVVEYKDALQPADFYHNFKQRGIRSVQLIPYLEFDDLNGIVDRAVLAAAGDADVASGAARLSARHRSIVISSMGERCCFIRSRITRICGAE